MRRGAVAHAPDWMKRSIGPVFSYLDMLFIDHGIFRVIYLNKHRIAGTDGWRAAQPTPGQVRRLARSGIKTIVNLRGERLCGSYWLETAACARHGVKLENFQVRSRAAPSQAELHGARELFQRIFTFDGIAAQLAAINRKSVKRTHASIDKACFTDWRVAARCACRPRSPISVA